MVVETEALERHYVGNDFITASDIIVAMSTALDLTEGQPCGARGPIMLDWNAPCRAHWIRE